MPRRPRPARWLALMLLCAAPQPRRAQRPARPLAPPTAAALRPALDSLYGALARGDSAALRRWLADDLTWLDPGSGREVGKAQLLAAAGGARGPAATYDVDSVRVRTVAGAPGLALLGYRRVDRRRVGGYESTARWRAADLFAWRGGRWQLVRHARSWLPAPVAAAAVVPLDSAALAAFVGRYAVAPGLVDDVHWEGGHLVATITGFPPGARLVPVGATVFSPDGTGALLAFERDAAGRVTGYVQGFPDGRVLRRPRLP